MYISSGKRICRVCHNANARLLRANPEVRRKIREQDRVYRLRKKQAKLLETIRREQRASIRRRLLELHQAGYTLRLRRVDSGGWVFCALPPNAEMPHAICIRADRVDALGNGLQSVSL